MKKLLSLLMAVALVCGVASAKDRYTKNVNELPAAAVQFLKANFPKHTVHHIKIDKKAFGGSDYDVILSNGTEIEFDAKGNWTEVDCGNEAVPSGVIMKSIASYVKSNYSGAKIVKIEKGSRDYDVELSNGIDLKFGRDGSFKRVD